jgi:hypothetical protein
VFIFQFLNDKLHSYVVFDIIVHFIIQNLKNKHTFLKIIQTEKAEEPLILTERVETKIRYFAPISVSTAWAWASVKPNWDLSSLACLFFGVGIKNFSNSLGRPRFLFFNNIAGSVLLRTSWGSKIWISETVFEGFRISSGSFSSSLDSLEV